MEHYVGKPRITTGSQSGERNIQTIAGLREQRQNGKQNQNLNQNRNRSSQGAVNLGYQKKANTQDAPGSESQMKNILIKLPESMRERIVKLPKVALQKLEEIRIRTDTDTLLISGGREYSLRDRDEMTAEVLEEILNRLMDYSYYAYEEELARGYITIEGGHRVGICGRVTLENDRVHLIKDVSSLNIRRSREIMGASDKILGAVLSPAKAPAEGAQNARASASRGDSRSSGAADLSGICFSSDGFGSTASSHISPSNMAVTSDMTVRNTLIISPPKCGKTTILRDLARSLSYRGFRIGICDERSEIAGCYDGKTSYDLGPRTDVLDGCPKAEGILMLIRAMSPDVIMTDEIGKTEDAAAIRSALSAGVKIITTIHGSSFEDAAKSSVGDLITDHVFETLIFLSAQPVTGTVEKILRLPEVSHG